MGYSVGQMVRRLSDGAYGEVLTCHGKGKYTVKYPIFGDEDRDFEITQTTFDNMRPIEWGECERELYKGGYPVGKGEWHVPY